MIVYIANGKVALVIELYQYEALGVKDSATIRTFYHPGIHAKLKSVQVIVVKNADATAIVDGIPNKNNPNIYELGVELIMY